MQLDFHYYATYCAAFLAGYSHEECMDICYSAQFCDNCTRTLLSKIGGPSDAATTQLSLEMMDARMDKVGIADITRIWSSFHFLPYDLYADCRGNKKYKDKFRLICKPNGAILPEVVELAKGGELQAVGVAMHVLADTWAHSNFAGTPSLVINNTNYYFYEMLDDDRSHDRQIKFKHSLSAPDDIVNGVYVASLYNPEEKTIMNLGHGRAGHFPDYSFARYRYMPAWGDYEEIVKDNPLDYMHAFKQMVFAMRYIRGQEDSFEVDRYADAVVKSYEERINTILTRRQLDSSEDWKSFGEELSGQPVKEFDVNEYQDAYINADASEKEETYLGRFIKAALAHKGLVSNRIYASGNKLVGKASRVSGKAGDTDESA